MKNLDVNTLTKEERAKLYRKLYKYLRKISYGGGLFGMDFFLKAMSHPQICGVMRRIAKTDNYHLFNQ